MEKDLTNDQLIKLARFYDKLLVNCGLQSLKDHPVRLGHCRWMLMEIIKHTKSNPKKYNRWMGFVQGVLWCDNICTINEMRKHVTNVKNNCQPDSNPAT